MFFNFAAATIAMIMAFWGFMGYHYCRGARQEHVLQSEHALTEQCKPAYKRARIDCGCSDAQDLDGTAGEGAEVFLVYFITPHRTGPHNTSRWNFFPKWSGTTHWAIEIRGFYYELCRNRDSITSTGYDLAETSVHTVRRYEYIYEAALGVTHFSNAEIKEIGKRYAEGYVWDPFFRNCQVFLWEAYLGRRYTFARKQEIRCNQVKRLELPVFTAVIIASIFGLTYAISSLLNWYFIPATLTVATFWLSIIFQMSPIIAGILILTPLIRNRYLYHRSVSRQSSSLGLNFREWFAANLRSLWMWTISPIGRMIRH